MPPPRILTQLNEELADLDARCLRRILRALPAPGPIATVDGRELVNLASNDYLGLGTHDHLRRRGADATLALGTGAGASRLVAGHLALHEQVESRFARFKHAEAALLLPTGYMANLAVLTSLAGPGDLVCLDKLVHASLIDAARASEATVRTHPHGDLRRLEHLLARPLPASPGRRPPRRFIVTDSIFSMDGDAADLPALCDLADAHDAMLVVDEAHATGVLGATGAGLCEAQHVAERVATRGVVVSTASKGLGGLGGVVTGPRVVIDTLVNRARSLIYTTAVPPGQAAAIDAALDVVASEPWRRERVAAMAHRVRDELRDAGWALPTTAPATPIIPLIVGAADRALALAAHLRDAGLLAVAIRPPTVAPNTARVRISLRADLADQHIDRLLDGVATWCGQAATYS
ncbi:MAG: 8-amino-7-oxononanoate synthase [Phycisphaeraceae bacterium]